MDECILKLLTALLVIHATNGTFKVEDETELRANLSAKYNPQVRPDGTTKVSVQLHVTAINSVDIKNEVFTISGWWSMTWQDSRLAWENFTEYSGIPVIQTMDDTIWTPVLVVSNSINDLSAIDEDTIPLRVDNAGKVFWNPPALLQVSCTMDVTYFPFDTQTCSIEVTSFGYTIKELNIVTYNDGLSFRYYQPSGEWDIKNNYHNRGTYEEDGYTYARVTFSINMARKPLYYGINMILPIIVNSGLTLFVFLLPPESGEKIGYCLTVLLAFMVILTLVATDLPTTATSTPLLEIYIAIVLVMGGLSVIFAIIVLHIFFLPETKPVPDWVQRTSLTLMKACFISRVDPVYDGTSKDSVISTSDVKAKTDNMDLEERPKQSRRRGTLSRLDTERSPTTSSQVSWQTVATVIDGVCFRIYSLFLVASTLVIMIMIGA